MRASGCILKFAMATVGIILACLIPPNEAFSFDVHELFESRCGSCHQHAGNVSRERLVISDGVLRGRVSGRNIRVFLPDHYGYPNPDETAALYDLFFSQKQDGGKFKARCAVCHVRARELARLSLIRDGDSLRGRYTGRDITEFLSNHGRIEATEIDIFIEMLMPMAPTTSNSPPN